MVAYSTYSVHDTCIWDSLLNKVGYLRGRAAQECKLLLPATNSYNKKISLTTKL